MDLNLMEQYLMDKETPTMIKITEQLHEKLFTLKYEWRVKRFEDVIWKLINNYEQKQADKVIEDISNEVKGGDLNGTNN